MDIILIKRTRNGETVFDIDEMSPMYSQADKQIEEIKSHISDNLVPFVKPIGQRNSYYQYYVDGNSNDILTIDILEISDFINHSSWLLKGCKRNERALKKLPIYLRTHSYFDTSGLLD